MIQNRRRSKSTGWPSSKCTSTIQSLFPTRGEHAKQNAAIVDFNKRLKAIAQEFGYTYVDLHSLFVDEHGELKAEYTEDGLHLKPAAYEVWRDEVERIMGWSGAARNVDEE